MLRRRNWRLKYEGVQGRALKLGYVRIANRSGNYRNGMD